MIHKELEPGIYTQMRLYLGADPDDSLNKLDEPHPFPNYVILDNPGNDLYRELKVPSGYQSGIKLVREFVIEAGALTELLLDFDAAKSVVKAGKSGKYLLKPTIKIIDTVQSATLSGMGTDNQPIGLGSVQVSAQIYDEGPTEEPQDQKDWISTYTTTFTDDGDGDGNIGEYMMYLAPGNYNIVVYVPELIPQFIPQCRPVIATDGEVLAPEDFQLTAVESGTIAGVVDIEDPVAGQTAILSFRQSCGENQAFEVDSLTDAYGNYSIDLPEGVYDVVGSSEGRVTFEWEDIPVALGTPVQLNFNLQLPPL